MLDFAGGLVNMLQISNCIFQKAAGNVAMLNSGVCVVKKTTPQATQVTLPARGMFAWVKDGAGNAAADNITVVPDGTTNNTTIDGAANQVISSNYGHTLFFHNGTEWGVIG
jgi:hypothetical protein